MKRLIALMLTVFMILSINISMQRSSVSANVVQNFGNTIKTMWTKRMEVNL